MTDISLSYALETASDRIYMNKTRDPLLHKFDRFSSDKTPIVTTLGVVLRQYLRGIIGDDVEVDSLVPHAGNGFICIGISDSTNNTFNPLSNAQIIIRYIKSVGGPSIRISQMLSRGETTLEYIQIPIHEILVGADDEYVLSKFEGFIASLATKIMEIHARMEIHELSSVVRKLRLKHIQSKGNELIEEIIICPFPYSDFIGLIYNPYA